ncbi:MAG TPA: HAD family phosphatase [Bryobacteraceae bacterium]|nr:HAD family phosphatase [Bryobacteraceae bacterium]
MPTFDSILFDFDGVLADTEPVHCACWAEVLVPHGITLEWQDYRERFMGIDDREMLRILARERRPQAEWEDLWRLYPAKKDRFRTHVIGTPPFDATLQKFLGDLGGRYGLAVVSSSSCSEIEPMLEAGGVRQFFGTVVGAESVKNHKPAPDPYLLAAERLGVRAPLVVEDSEAGLASGRAAGFEVLAVPHPAEMLGLLTRRLAVS